MLDIKTTLSTISELQVGDDIQSNYYQEDS